MKIGFWNINQNTHAGIKTLIAMWADAHDLDILVLLECKISDPDLEESLNQINMSNYMASPSFLPKPYFRVFTKFDKAYSSPVKDAPRIQAREIIEPFVGRFSLVLVHYPSKLHWQEQDQNAGASELGRFVEDLENQVGHDRTLILGDFNMHPFQAGMVQTTGLHATMDKRTALQQSRVVNGREYKFFYNPMWSFFGEKGKGKVNVLHGLQAR
jgi:exonuclease III